MKRRYRIEWQTAAGALVAFEPQLSELEPHIPALVAAYNDPRNATLLGHTAALTADDVRDHYRALLDGGRPFLLLRDNSLAGDADLRGLGSRLGEFAFLIADPASQGRGLGTRFALMIHAFAFTQLRLDRIYASVVPANTASLRVFSKLGYTEDNGRTARSFADPGDITLAIDRDTFDRTHAAAVAELRIAPR